MHRTDALKNTDIEGSDRSLIARNPDASKSQRLMLSICCTAYPFRARSVPDQCKPQSQAWNFNGSSL